MARKYTYGHGGETDVISMTDQMHEAKEIVGAKKWDSLSQEERKNLTKYLVMKGEIEGEGEDYYYAKGGVAKGGKLDVGVYRVGKPTKISANLYEQKIVEIFDNGDISTASDYGRNLSDFKVQKYPIISKERLEEQYKYADGGMMAKGGKPEPKPLSDSALKKLEGFQERKRARGEQTEGTLVARVIENQYKRRNEPKVIHTQFEEEDFEYAHGGRTGKVSKIKDWYTKNYPTDDLGEELNDNITFKGLWGMMSQGYDVYEVLGVGDSIVRERVFEKLSEILGVDYDVVYNKWLQSGKYADGGMMAKGGELDGDMMSWGGKMAHGGKTRTRHRKQTLEEKAMESVGSATWFQLDKETQAGVIADMLSIGALPQRMAKGAKVAENKEFSVTYELLDGKKVTEKYESQEAMDDGIANFYIMNDVKDAIVGGAKEEVVKEEVKEVKKEEKPKKKGLFDVEKAAPKVSKSKETAPIVHVDGLEKEIQRYDELKAVIKNAEAEKEVIGGVIKDVAKDKYLEVYEQQGKRPTTIIIESGGTEIGYTVLDKYKIVTPEKETVLKEYDGLLGTDYTFTFDNEILDKEGKNGEKIADIINDLIENSEDIPDDLKSKLVKITKKVGVKKGSIERLLAYDSPSEILQVIEPVEMLK